MKLAVVSTLCIVIYIIVFRLLKTLIIYLQADPLFFPMQSTIKEIKKFRRNSNVDYGDVLQPIMTPMNKDIDNGKTISLL